MTGAMECRKMVLAWAAATALAMALACAGTARAQTTISGQVLGGGKTIYNSSVALYDASSPSLALATATTDHKGSFTLSFSGPSNGSDVLYVTATGGGIHHNPNTAILLVAVLGAASSAPASVVVDDLTTAATAWAMAQFAQSGGVISGSSPGLPNAALNSANLADVTTGQDVALTGGNTVAESMLNTIANVIAQCVTASGPSSGSCSSLFSAAAPPGGTAPSNTFDAALDIAKNPANNAGAIFALAPTAAHQITYTPVLPGAPNAWVAALSFSGGGLSSPEGVAVDASGNIWAANSFSSTVTELGPDGSALSGFGYTASSLSQPFGVAVDGNGNVWVTNYYNGQVTELCGATTANCPIGSATGNQIFASAAGGLNGPEGIAIDQLGNVWVANNSGNSVTELDSSGNALSGSGYTDTSLSAPIDVAIDGNGNVWVADSGNNEVTELCGANTANCPSMTATGSAILASAAGAGGLNGPAGIAIDQSGNAWVANNSGNSVTELDSNGSALSPPTGYTGGGLGAPVGIAIDGAGNVWVVNNFPPSVTELSSAGSPISPSAGYTGGSMNGPQWLAIDPSGNVWVGNSTDGSVTELVGAAAPVTTPLK
jgi:sugar lactone lactonase YvrE